MSMNITLDEVRRHYERRGLEFQPFDLLDTPAITAVQDGIRFVLEGTEYLACAAMTFPTDDVPEDELNELAELIVPGWDPVGGFVPEDTHILSVKRDGVHIRFIRVKKINRCLFSIEPG